MRIAGITTCGDGEMTVLFVIVLFTGTAAIATWLHVRLPSLTARSLVWPMLAAAVSTQLLAVVPVWTRSWVQLYASIFGELLPLLVVVWLSMLWLLSVLRDYVRTAR